MLTIDFFNARNDSRKITFQIAETMKSDNNFNVNFKPHPDMNEYGAVASHLILSTYQQFIHYLQKEMNIPEEYEAKLINYDLFVKGLKDTDKMIQDLMNELSMDDLQKTHIFGNQPTDHILLVGAYSILSVMNDGIKPN